MEQTLKQRIALKRSILDPQFRYVRSEKTDLRKTFAWVRKEQQQQK